MKRFTLALLLSLLLSTAAMAGDAALAWDAVTDSDLAGYQISRGTASGVYDELPIDVGNVLSFIVTDAPDCRPTFYCLKAYDTDGLYSEACSNEVSGWPQPVVTTILPDNILGKGANQQTYQGTNYQALSTVRYLDDLGLPWVGVTVNQVTVSACGQMVVDLTVDPGAPKGLADLEIQGSDGVYRVYADAIQIEPAPGQVQNLRRTDKK